MGKEGLHVIRDPAEQVNPTHNGTLMIATGRSRNETAWKNKEMTWGALASRLHHSLETKETHAQFMKMSTADQGNIKDVGGFVGGCVDGGRRNRASVRERTVLTLDADHMTKGMDIADLILEKTDSSFTFVIYSTHKHTPDAPRQRLVVPLARAVSSEEYEAIARKIAEKIDIEIFDDSTYEPHRLMYWPSHSFGSEPYYYFFDGKFLDPDKILKEYPDWTDTSYWPESSRMSGTRKKAADKQGDPLAKKGVVGAFCRTYPIVEAISKFLPEVYVPTAREDRYTYAAGSTAAGLVIYDGVFAYSNHSTDPAGGQLCNAFDLVRVHKFGHLDEKASFKAMSEFAADDDDTKIEIANARLSGAKEDFAPLKEGEDWRTRLRLDKNGQIVSDATNALLILTYDEHLQSIRRNDMSGRVEAKELPWSRPGKHWRDVDSDQLYMWVANEYRVQFADSKFVKAFNTAADNRRVHPVKEYLEGLPEWDGVERAETFLIDYLGAEDNIYVRDVTRKTLTAAVARIYEPGTKFDYVLVLVGRQGIGKSTAFRRLAGEWFSDSLTLTDMKDKTGAEQLQDHWILELGEMAGMRKAEVETVKGFVSRQVDTYRPAYGRNVESHPRQCILVGSTNAESGFLRDITGNRRFWPVNVPGIMVGDDPKPIPDDIVEQVWAEAKVIYQIGEDLYLSGDAERIAFECQREAMETDERQGLVEKYLDTLLPDNWDGMGLDERCTFFSEGDDRGTVLRQTVTNAEIWTECLGNRFVVMQPRDSYAIAAIMAKIPGWERTNDRQMTKLYGRQRLYKKVIP